MSFRIARAASLARSPLSSTLLRPSPTSFRPISTSSPHLYLPPGGKGPDALPRVKPDGVVPPSPSDEQSASNEPAKTENPNPRRLLIAVAFISVAIALKAALTKDAAQTESTTPPAPVVVAPAAVAAAAPLDPVALPTEIPMSPLYLEAVAYAKSLQQSITGSIEALEAESVPTNFLGQPTRKPATFLRDSWTRPNNGGEGISCVLAGGTVLEKGGVNISIINGVLPPRAVQQMRADHAGLETVAAGQSLPYAVVGLSIVLHPNNPMAPTCHFNFRYFETYDPKDLSKPVASWFGGGSDLTPNYLFPEDAIHFHSTLKAACDAHADSYYPAFKTWCDKYFHIPHRSESRGVGGIFFDDLDSSSPIHFKAAKYSSGVGPEMKDIWKFVQSVGDAFVPSYVPILRKRHGEKWGEREKRWQQLRRGRYVEFNLVNDRGTKFGLMTPGSRIESVLMSLPSTARWEYMTDMGTDPSSPEGKLMEVLRKPVNWV